MINWVVDHVTRILAEHFQNEPGSDRQNWSSELFGEKFRSRDWSRDQNLYGAHIEEIQK